MMIGIAKAERGVSMTRFEKFQRMTIEELTDELCSLHEKFQRMTIEKLADELCSLLWCEECPMYEKCKHNQDDANGFLEWLKGDD